MGLCEEYQDLRIHYRKLFYECVQEIESLLAQGNSIKQIEVIYRQKWQKSLADMEENRANCDCCGCGVCCKFAVSEFSPEQLALKAQNCDYYALQFLETFVPYGSVDEARKIYPEYVEFLLKIADGKAYFYHCPKVTEDNRCPDYENRPQICRDFPDNPLAFLPKSCSFTTWKLKSESVCLKLNAEKEIIDFYLKGNM